MHVRLLLAAAAAFALTSARPAAAASGRALLLAQAEGDARPADAGSGSGSAKKKRRGKRKAKKADQQKPADAAPSAEAKPAETPPPAAAEKAAEPPPVEAAPPSAPPTEVKAGEPPPPAVEAQKPPEAAPTTDAPPPPPPEATVVKPAEPPPAAAAAAPPQGNPPAESASQQGEDLDPPTIAHEPVTHAPRGHTLKLEAHVTDPSGVFQVVLFLRKQGMADYIPLKFVADKITMGTYSVEVPTALVSVPLEYYIETYDNLGNGPARAGSPERPLPIKIDEPPVVQAEEPKKIVVPGTPKGAPPSITHSSVPKAYKGKAVEIPARLRGETGVGAPVVKWRQLGDSEFRTLPMGLIGGDQYTATIPASQITKDIEYYLEATDKYGNGPGRSGGPDAPFLIRVEDEPPPPPPTVVVKKDTASGRRRAEFVPAPFKPNPLRSGAYLVLAASLGSLVFAGGEAYGAWQSNENYTHTFKYEGRDDQSLLKRANEYGKRAKLFGIIGLSTAVVATVLLIVFPEHSDVVPAPEGGSGGDGAVLFRF